MKGFDFMFSAIVVDDEPIIRSSISSFINDCDAGFTVAESFRDGSDAIKYLEENNVDLVISDIKMVTVSGIDLAQYIYENKPWIHVILLSGYTEFEYAKAAIKYNVKEYITKPTNFDDLKNTLIKIRNLITEQKNNNNINVFLDSIMQLYAAIIAKNSVEAQSELKLLLDGNTRKNEQLGQYAFNIFEIIIDKLYANLNIRITSELTDYNVLLNTNSKNEVYQTSSEILDHILNHLLSKDKKTDNIVIDKLIQFINENFSRNISLQDAAETVFFNPAYCSRFFKEQTGENFSDYLLKVRMEHAAHLLKENKKVTDISKECGYNSSGYFTRVFKEYYNCTPSEYIHNIQRS